MTRYTLGAVLILLATANYGLAQEGPPYPDTNNSGSGSVRRLDLPSRDQYGNAPWLNRDAPWPKRKPVVDPDPGAWYRLRIRQDLGALNRTWRELFEQAQTPGQTDRRALARGASKVAKLSRNLWSDIQHGKSDRAKPESEARRVGRLTGDPIDGIRALESLIDEVKQAVTDEDRTRTVDANRRGEILDKLEAINRLALGISGGLGR